MRSIKKMLAEQDVVVGLMVQHVCQPWIAKVYADAGSDFLYVENEHMLFNQADLAGLITASRSYGMPVVAKCEYLSRGSVCKLLDAGVTGIQLPMSETAEQLEELVSYCRFPPVGVRAAAPGTGNTDYRPVDMTKWLTQCNEEITVLAHIESKRGLDNVDEILSVPGVDMMFIGMFDLSVSLGHPADYAHPVVVAAMDKLVASAKAYGKPAGMWAPKWELAEPWIAKGIRFFESIGDIGLIANNAIELIKQFPGHGPKNASGQAHI